MPRPIDAERTMAAFRIRNGWLVGVPRSPSPYQDARPDGASIDLVVVHGISLPPGQFGGPWIDDLFLGRLDPAAHPYFAEIGALRVSAHVLVRRDGACVQYVPFQRRAWHAGESSFCGRSRCNDFSVGIELEGADDVPYTAPQYARLAALVAALRRRYPGITPERVVGHSDVSPGRKTDPGPAFDWPAFQAALAGPSRARGLA
jgi:AmpD protein